MCETPPWVEEMWNTDPNETFADRAGTEYHIYYREEPYAVAIWKSWGVLNYVSLDNLDALNDFVGEIDDD